MTQPRGGQASYRYWTPPEIEKLLELAGDLPFASLVREWNRWAKLHDMPRRSSQSIRKKLTALGESTCTYGAWIRLGDVAALLGKDRSTIGLWARRGLVKYHRAASQSCILRADLKRLARRKPQLFAGCPRAGLVQLLEEEELADSILSAYPERYQSVVTGRRVLWVDKQQVFPSAAARAANVSHHAIRKAIAEGRTTCGYRFERLM